MGVYVFKNTFIQLDFVLLKIKMIYQGLITLSRNIREALNMFNNVSKENTTLFFLLFVTFRTLIAATAATLFPTYCELYSVNLSRGI